MRTMWRDELGLNLASTLTLSHQWFSLFKTLEKHFQSLLRVNAAATHSLCVCVFTQLAVHFVLRLEERQVSVEFFFRSPLHLIALQPIFQWPITSIQPTGASCLPCLLLSPSVPSISCRPEILRGFLLYWPTFLTTPCQRLQAAAYFSFFSFFQIFAEDVIIHGICCWFITHLLHTHTHTHIYLL